MCELVTKIKQEFSEFSIAYQTQRIKEINNIEKFVLRFPRELFVTLGNHLCVMSEWKPFLL